jgi:ketosteroid isomerase-like protein
MDAEDQSAEFDRTIEQIHLALDAFAKGTHEPLKELYSERDDATLGNPFGPVRGPDQIDQTMRRAASFYKDGEATGFEQISKQITGDLAYIVEVESFKAKVGGGEDVTPFSLRCTSIFRRENGRWRLLHRHADPITTARSAESLFEQ